ncbi:MAG: DNA mismatch endonuclease Vsr [Exiguobacterium profundum]|nr:MAG: DNA mismatch endonuclease Vsr [Exiguobacterium profundum]
MDRVTPTQRSENMRRIRSKGTGPELLVRKLCHALGYRFRLHRKDLPGKPDLVFPGRKAVIFVHGCFWHQHPSETCPKKNSPKSNLAYWEPKLTRNVQRDGVNQAALVENGWSVLIIWECQTKDFADLRLKIVEFLGQRSSSTSDAHRLVP